MKVNNVRFIERDYYKSRLAADNKGMSEAQMDKLLDSSGKQWVDLTFTFYENGSLTIIDNYTDRQVPLSELKGPACDFYVQQRIRMIRANLEAKIAHSA